MKQIFLALFFICLFSSQAFCQEATYCGQITKFVAEPGKSNKIQPSILFKEMDSGDGYTKQLPKKVTVFRVKSGDPSNEEYSGFILQFISTINYDGMCITVNKKNNTVTGIVAGG